MQEVSRNAPSRYTEGDLRLRATLRAMLSPGIWLVLAAQIALVFSLQWRVPEGVSPLVSALAVFLTVTVLILFVYLQAGAFHALTLGREALSVGEMVRAGKAVFGVFVWLTLKAGVLLVVILNAFVYVALLLTGHDLKTVINALSPFFSPMVGVLAFVFVYWLPWVFVRREFRLFVSLKTALQIARARLSHSAFLALLVFAPTLVSGYLSAAGLAILDVLVSVAGGVMGWIAYIYCVEALREQPKDAGIEASV